MNENLSDFKLNPDEKTLTKTMINNYTKNDLLPPPVKKKYSKEHMIVLTFIYYFKSVLSIGKIQDMLSPLIDKFFDPADNSGKLTLEYVYNEVYAATKSQVRTVSQDIAAKTEASERRFSKVKNEEDREFLKAFSMICMLNFDVFLKKQIIESLIVSLAPKDETDKKEN